MTYEQKCKKIMNPLDKSERSDYNKSILKFLEQRQVTCCAATERVRDGGILIWKRYGEWICEKHRESKKFGSNCRRMSYVIGIRIYPVKVRRIRKEGNSIPAK